MTAVLDVAKPEVDTNSPPAYIRIRDGDRIRDFNVPAPLIPWMLEQPPVAENWMRLAKAKGDNLVYPDVASVCPYCAFHHERVEGNVHYINPNGECGYKGTTTLVILTMDPSTGKFYHARRPQCCREEAKLEAMLRGGMLDEFEVPSVNVNYPTSEELQKMTPVQLLPYQWPPSGA
jgi:hypothetical protein